MRKRTTAAGLLGAVCLAGMIGWTGIEPSNDRTWQEEQRMLPRADLAGSMVTLHNVRDFRWGPGDAVQPGWETRTYDLDRLSSVWYILTPFSRDRRGPAHGSDSRSVSGRRVQPQTTTRGVSAPPTRGERG